VWHDGKGSFSYLAWMEAFRHSPNVSFHQSEERQHDVGVDPSAYEHKHAVCCDVRRYKPELRGYGWGHYNRARALETVDTEWVWFQNADNQVIPRAVEVLNNFIEQVPDADCIVWPILHNYRNYEPFLDGFGNCQTDMSQFIVKTDLAKAVGFNHRCFIADGIFLEELKAYKPDLKVYKQPIILGIHN
jgi:hypothetical protein